MKKPTPGEIFCEAGDIELNVGRKTKTLTASNTGDRPIQIGSHFHFYEVNEAMKFDREAAYGMRLNIMELDGDRAVYGFNQKVMGKLK